MRVFGFVDIQPGAFAFLQLSCPSGKDEISSGFNTDFPGGSGNLHQLKNFKLIEDDEENASPTTGGWRWAVINDNTVAIRFYGNLLCGGVGL